MNITHNPCAVRLLFISGLLFSMSGWAQSQPVLEKAYQTEVILEEVYLSPAEIAAQLADPNTILGTLNFNLDYVSYAGDLPDAGDQSAVRMSFQPVLPYPVGEGVNFFLRPNIPVIFKQDVPVAGGFDNPGFNLGDIGFDAALGKSFSGGFVVVGGVAGTLPTATDDALGNGQWALGPEIAGAVVRKWGVLGLLVSHQWDVAGSDNAETNVTGGQYFYVFNLKDGWQISSSPTFSYNHEAASGQRWTVPVGIGVSKTSILSGRPWKFGLQFWSYVEAPDAFGPDWQVRFTVSPVVNLPW